MNISPPLKPQLSALEVYMMSSTWNILSVVSKKPYKPTTNCAGLAHGCMLAGYLVKSNMHQWPSVIAQISSPRVALHRLKALPKHSRFKRCHQQKWLKEENKDYVTTMMRYTPPGTNARSPNSFKLMLLITVHQRKPQHLRNQRRKKRTTSRTMYLKKQLYRCMHWKGFLHPKLSKSEVLLSIAQQQSLLIVEVHIILSMKESQKQCTILSEQFLTSHSSYLSL